MTSLPPSSLPSSSPSFSESPLSPSLIENLSNIDLRGVAESFDAVMKKEKQASYQDRIVRIGDLKFKMSAEAIEEADLAKDSAVPVSRSNEGEALDSSALKKQPDVSPSLTEDRSTVFAQNYGLMVKFVPLGLTESELMARLSKTVSDFFNDTFQVLKNFENGETRFIFGNDLEIKMKLDETLLKIAIYNQDGAGNELLNTNDLKQLLNILQKKYSVDVELTLINEQSPTASAQKERQEQDQGRQNESRQGAEEDMIEPVDHDVK